jgi:hypothetical protein
MVFGVVEDVNEVAAVQGEAFGEAALFEGLDKAAVDGDCILLKQGNAIVGGGEVANGEGGSVVGGSSGGAGGEQGPVVTGEAGEGEEDFKVVVVAGGTEKAIEEGVLELVVEDLLSGGFGDPVAVAGGEGGLEGEGFSFGQRRWREGEVQTGGAEAFVVGVAKAGGAGAGDDAVPGALLSAGPALEGAVELDHAGGLGAVVDVLELGGVLSEPGSAGMPGPARGDASVASDGPGGVETDVFRVERDALGRGSEVVPPGGGGRRGRTALGSWRPGAG